MHTSDVKDVLEEAIRITRTEKVKVIQKPRLLSDNGPCYVSKELSEYLNDKNIKHSHCTPYHPQTQGKIERFHRSMKNIILLDNYYSPEELERQIESFVDYYNNERYHEGINNLRPVDVYNGKTKELLKIRSNVKLETLAFRKLQNLNYLYN